MRDAPNPLLSLLPTIAVLALVSVAVLVGSLVASHVRTALNAF